jgi:hypothetical protein
MTVACNEALRDDGVLGPFCSFACVEHSSALFRILAMEAYNCERGVARSNEM